jgi:selT/selW/selH-like putative selenoprotein
LAAALEDRYDDVTVTLSRSHGGRFEVTADGRLVYSKKATGRHAEHDEVFAAIEG